jgi:hypothetical protein
MQQQCVLQQQRRGAGPLGRDPVEGAELGIQCSSFPAASRRIEALEVPTRIALRPRAEPGPGPGNNVRVMAHRAPGLGPSPIQLGTWNFDESGLPERPSPAGVATVTERAHRDRNSQARDFHWQRSRRWLAGPGGRGRAP